MRVAIVNDQRLAVEALRRVVCSDASHTVAWTAADGAEAVHKCQQDRPDVILMDLLMPEMNGAEATRQIMQRCPCPILVVTATVAGNYSLVCEALGHGAYDAVATPVLGGLSPAQAGATLLARLARVETIRRRLESPKKPSPTAEGAWHATMRGASKAPPLLALGASTGGPQALKTVLASLPADLPAAVIVAQHISAEFSESLVGWLSGGCRLRVRAARSGDRPEPGQVLVASTDDHLVLSSDRRLEYTAEPADNPFRPSVDVLFDSLARHAAPPSMAVLLTGIGRDGAQGLLNLRRAGWFTIAQDASTSVVYGMPRAAAELGAAVRIAPLGDIATHILSYLDGVKRP